LGLEMIEDGKDIASQASRCDPDLLHAFLLPGDLEDPAAPAIADLRLSHAEADAAALDLVLGCQRPLAAEKARDARRSPAATGLSPPVLFDNLDELRTRYEATLSEYRAKRTHVVNALIMLGFFGGLALALLVTMLALLRIVWGSRLWLPTVVATVCCIVVTAVSNEPSRMKPVEAAAVEFRPYLPHSDAEAKEQDHGESPGVAVKPADAKLQSLAEKLGKSDADAEDLKSDRFAVRQYPLPDVARSSNGGDGAKPLAWYPLLIAGADGLVSVPNVSPDAGRAVRLMIDAHSEGRLESCELIVAQSVSEDASLTLRVTIPAESPVDVVVYGGTSAGVAAAVQVARMGKSVVLIEPGRHVGGLTSGGLGRTDIGNKAAIGGIAREFYQRVHRYYGQKKAWTRETRSDYVARAGDLVDADAMWGFEPHVAEKIFREMLAEAGVKLVCGQRLDLGNGVRKQGARISAIVMESGEVYVGRAFIDATYEGDLMAKAGVSYAVGREANSRYGETLNGVETRYATQHQFNLPVDPFVIPGNAQSGLLPGVHSGSPGVEGEGDRRIQAYNYRMCLTDVPANRVPFARPAGYDPRCYEILVRYIAAGWQDALENHAAMPNRKTDTNNNGAFSTDDIGMNYDYPEAGYARREKLAAEHRGYQLGLMWTMTNDPRVPADLRRRAANWGLAKDEFTDNGNWPNQLYIREARRLISNYVMTEHECRGQRVAADSIGLGAYGMDSHNTQRYVDAQGHVRNEGDIQVRVAGPYAISYRSIVPKAAECTNLLIPVCLSATHIAYGSIRMEPVFMVLGQSAATAAVQAVSDGADVQHVDYPSLRARLLNDNQILAWQQKRK